MNSKQRRKDHRAWKYIVEFDKDTMLWDQYHEIWDWTAQTFGTDLATWREAHNHIGTRWEFRHSKDAVLFRLKWGGK